MIKLDVDKKYIREIVSQVEIFSKIDDYTLNKIIKYVDMIRVGKNETLFEEGEVTDFIYVICSGRLLVLKSDENGIKKKVNKLVHNDIIGELSLLSDGKRQASVVAVRPSLLLRIDSKMVKNILNQSVELLLNFSKYISCLLLNETSKKNEDRNSFSQCSSLTIISESGLVNNKKIIDNLCDSISRNNPILRIKSDEMIELGENRSRVSFNIENLACLTDISKFEKKGHIIIYDCEDKVSAFSKFALENSDMIVYLRHHGRKENSNELGVFIENNSIEFEKCKKTLLLFHSDGKMKCVNDRNWDKGKKFDFIHHIYDVDTSLDKFVRIFLGKSINIVLSGGGSHGLAHIGVLKAIKECGINIDVVGGVSFGSIVGALFAMGNDADDIKEIWKDVFKKYKFKHILGYQVPISSLLNPKFLNKFVEHLFGDLFIEDMPLNYFSLATDITTTEDKIFLNGPIKTAVLSSSALPGICSPVPIDESLYIDGGATNTMPCDHMQRLYGGVTIGVNVSRERSVSFSKNLNTFPSSRNILINLINPFSTKMKVPSIIEIASRAAVIGNKKQLKYVRRYADLYLEPDLRHIREMDYHKFEESINIGYEYTLKNIELNNAFLDLLKR